MEVNLPHLGNIGNDDSLMLISSGFVFEDGQDAEYHVCQECLSVSRALMLSDKVNSRRLHPRGRAWRG